jgi:uncharacterized cupin superfamily protein
VTTEDDPEYTAVSGDVVYWPAKTTNTWHADEDTSWVYTVARRA